MKWLRASVCLLLAGWALAGCERLITDAATRLANQIRDEAAALRKSGETRRTFAHRPLAWPDGPAGDYRIEIISSAPPGDGQRAIFVAHSFSGPLKNSTSYHLNFVQVPRNLVIAHRKGEPTMVTLERRGDAVLLTDLR